ncbi:hypothetical protein KXX54_001501 [Aspergillus fumigatus]|uniref:Subtelomeric hrmA-associated cluster protein AFUA_5G14930 n=2 Tax=Aspergillus fumigatus TaxID=746128 RepID=HAC6_ASPFU|nr:conserved hypothetical protein [Aspergillus fumigatus Af293]EAL91126.1 conserved hypothetical protein [Aspergillus fumigatus Af293]EDP49871.1 conserved hypothetical protein [Aspergillus fumigatus A1163]KAH1842348.1 hypothetical protein KXX54_001501 [Aspergillus fumigatus]KEY83302.1 hypothetical protein BA78_6689 [Aspergillus fumigatus]
MANKKKPSIKKSVNEPNPHLKQSHASGSQQSLGDSLIEYNQPESSIPVCYIQNYPQFSDSYLYEPPFILSKVNEEVGHTVVHFLCTGNYETLRTASEPGASKIGIEFRRSMLVYQAAKEYDLYDLETYAKKYIEVFGESMSIFDIMEAAREIYSKLPKDEIWLTGYIYKQLEIAFSLDRNIFQRVDFYDGVGKDPNFDKDVMRMVVNIYSEVLSRQLDETTPEGSIAEDGAAEDCAAEDGAVEDGVVEEGAVEEGAVEEGAVEDGAVKDGAVEDGAVENGVAEECGAAEDVADDGALKEAVNLGIPSQPSGTALSFEWDHWTSGSKMGASFSGNSQWKYEKDTNSLYPENKAEESGGFNAAYEGIKSKKKKDKKKKKSNKDKKVEELAEPVPECGR